MRITKRIQKALAGNWGKPNVVEKDVKIPDPIFPENRHTGIKRNKDKSKQRNWEAEWHGCPFCKTILPLDEKAIEEKRKELEGTRYYIWEDNYRVKVCLSCGAYMVEKGCPACKRDVWYNPKTEIYKHRKFLSCGFEGKKLNRIET